MVDKYIEIIKPRIEKLFAEDSSGHDIGHLERVRDLAIRIARAEGGNELVVGLAGYMHDIHRLLQSQYGHYVSPAQTLPMVRDILKATDLKQNIIDEICLCIEYHECYNWNDGNINNINALIVQDADNIDAIGAIGVGRAFCYGGTYGIPMYSNQSLDFDQEYIEDNGDDDTTIHHFYHKLFRLGDYMNTTTAKEIAASRIEFMKKFAEEFIDEWNGRK